MKKHSKRAATEVSVRPIGFVGVESGQIIVADPRHVGGFPAYTSLSADAFYSLVCAKTRENGMGAQIELGAGKGQFGSAVAFSCTGGDGVFAVEGEYRGGKMVAICIGG